MGKAVGIDLGTTCSKIAVIEGRKPKVILSAEGDNLFPSVVAVNKNGARLVGQTACNQVVTNPENTICGIKRFMARKWDVPTWLEIPVKEDAQRKIYKVTRGPNDEVRVVMGGKEYCPEEISAMILQKLKQDAEAYLGEIVTDAVITVPASFNYAQRQATKDAGIKAGLNVLGIIDAPSAASLAYGLDRKGDETIAVYDLGGGTLDISILEIGDGTFQVKSIAGDTHLGGDDFDQRIVDWLITEFKKDQGIDLSQDKMAMQRLRESAEKAKSELSTVQQTEINLRFIIADASGPKHLNIPLTRAKLEQMVGDLVEKTMEPCKQALKDACKTAAQVDKVILVGGQTRMPLVQQKVTKFFGKEPYKGVNPDEVVAIGAAIKAGVLKGEIKDAFLLNVTPLTLGIETLGGVMTPLIPRNMTIPTSRSQVFTTSRDLQTKLEIHILQGERPMASDNISLGSLIFDGIREDSKGVPPINVTFDIDSNGILSVKVQDISSGNEKNFQPHLGASQGTRADPDLLPSTHVLSGESSAKDYHRENIVIDHGLYDVRPPGISSLDDMLDRQADRNLKEAKTEYWKERTKNEREKRNNKWWL